ncbi:MAG: hypothetical protein ACYSU8_11480 [Planctomycetota bacterium]|jgi:hypothetical protein
MKNKSINLWVTHILAFIVGIVFIFIALVFWDIKAESEQKQICDMVNETLDLRLKGDSIYKEYCTDNAVQKIENFWPLEAKSFWVKLYDYTWGTYEGFVFFDTGEIFYFTTTSRNKENHILDSFGKTKWPDRSKGEKGWLGWR